MFLLGLFVRLYNQIVAAGNLAIRSIDFTTRLNLCSLCILATDQEVCVNLSTIWSRKSSFMILLQAHYAALTFARHDGNESSVDESLFTFRKITGTIAMNSAVEMLCTLSLKKKHKESESQPECFLAA